jgi:hypothetical protein
MANFFISPTTQNVATKSGHSIDFQAGVSTHVPSEAQTEILALGIPRDGAETVSTEPNAEAAALAAAQAAEAAATAAALTKEADVVSTDLN